ncbi:uncharacterized protein MELLADRAFT_67827 [Melampsora larici-populina 98AG31]|uniref:Uncharacterized protein n=1 Tax=Melampsora larici-populina (strain 98AG31 / pathotype 3-4-7) TaxID=747676 RepID=F4S4K4_MELLP|nr:uncharacterized protein MELLADRAFT_67827 [Melampsora larici-populina 98AG31]EGG00429.1 hypothetical protein MELLADRAFT_67827 [Melampsora larici-populina 98AG31]
MNRTSPDTIDIPDSEEESEGRDAHDVHDDGIANMIRSTPDTIVIPESNDDPEGRHAHAIHEECIANITDYIIREGLTVQEFVNSARPSAYVTYSHQPPPSRDLLFARCRNVIGFIQSQNITVYDFVITLLEHPRLWAHRRSFLGTGTYSCSVVIRVFKALQNLIHAAGNTMPLWYEFIQAEADDLHINDTGGFPWPPL